MPKDSISLIVGPRKSLVTFADRADHVLVRNEAIRQKTSMTRLIRKWVDPHIDKLREEEDAKAHHS